MWDNAIKRIAYRPNDASVASGEPRTRIFDAIKKKELTAHKDGKRTLIFDDELRRWLKTFRTIGRNPAEANNADRVNVTVTNDEPRPSIKVRARVIDDDRARGPARTVRDPNG